MHLNAKIEPRYRAPLAGTGPAREREHPSSYQLPVTDTAYLVSPPAGVCLPFPGHNV